MLKKSILIIFYEYLLDKVVLYAVLKYMLYTSVCIEDIYDNLGNRVLNKVLKMELINFDYIDSDSAEEFISNHKIPNTASVLIQIFYSNQEITKLYRVRDELNTLLPNASLIATSTSGVISDGHFTDDVIKVSFSIFESSTTKSIGYSSKNIDEIIDDLDTDFVTNDTKLFVIFANTFTFDSTTFIQRLGERFPTVSLAGGNAGDDYQFKKCEVFTDNSENCDVVIAAVDSSELQVETKYLFNWQTIGQKMTVTKSEGIKVFEIDNRPAIEVYRYYLGDDVANDLLTFGIEFPIIFKDHGVDVARALVGFDSDEGSISFAGNVPQDVSVKFAYANVEHIEKENREMLLNDFSHKNEAIYIYSCGSRRQMLGAFLNEELADLNDIAPTVGFITYGEFFHDTLACQNNLLNITTTYVVLNESSASEPFALRHSKVEKDKRDITLKAITTLVSRTSDELDENIFYLKQFRNAVKEAYIFSIADASGCIQYVNKNFENISGYSYDELIGKNHNITRHEETPSNLFKNLWETIKKGKMWRGLLKNRRKDGTTYHAISNIVPMFYKDGSFREYISIKNDVTELEEYKLLLKNELDTTSKTLEGNLNYTRQYESAINSSIGILKTDTDNVITYANEMYCRLSGYTLEELVGKSCKASRSTEHIAADVCDDITLRLSEKKVFNEILTNVAKDGSEYVLNTLFYPVEDLNGSVFEYLHVMFDITEVTQLNKEIIDTQKEVVYTMGAIGETRSEETGAHVKRVAEYSYLLARLYGSSEEESNLLKQASPMHDIGKVAIPDNILNKPGKLTFDEMEIMKTHARIGYEMLKHSNRSILKASATVALTHHEKWDGSGYPYGLKGDDIHLHGRITAIADVFDALGHERVYKEAWPMKEILMFFKEQRGKHFEPRLIDLFLDNLDMFLEIKEKFNQDDVESVK